MLQTYNFLERQANEPSLSYLSRHLIPYPYSLCPPIPFSMSTFTITNPDPIDAVSTRVTLVYVHFCTNFYS